MRKVRLAIVGCGTISQLNAPGYLAHDRCEVAALCDPVPERAELRAREWGISPRIYASYDDVLADDRIDAVELLTPTFLHPDQSIAALQAGKHVSCQKPAAGSIHDIRRMADAAAAPPPSTAPPKTSSTTRPSSRPGSLYRTAQSAS